MKTETQIAEENINFYKECKKSYEDSGDKSELTKQIAVNSYNRIRGECHEHNRTCQRFLAFLEKRALSNILTKEKITDLETAIKKYDDNGI